MKSDGGQIIKYCSKCGAEIDNDAQICPICGNSTDNVETEHAENTNYTYQPKFNALCIVGFVFSFFIPIVGLICSIIGLKKAKTNFERGQGLAIAGIVISVVNWIFNIIFYAAGVLELISPTALL